MLDFTRLDDKRVLITGAADGIGLALAEAFGSAGAELFLTDIAAEKLSKVADRLGAESAACDVSDEAAMEALVERAWDEHGPFDLLCANAGVIKPGSLLDAERADVDWILGVNVWGILHACRPFVRRLRAAARPGHLLMTGSEHSLSNPAYLRSLPLHAYNMTKHCVLSLADSLRAELESEDVGVSVLCPGPIESGLNENSAQFRPERFGGAGEMVVPDLSEEQIKGLVSLYRPGSWAATVALEGLRRGVFVIPTHGFEREDVAARHRDIEAGFEMLEALEARLRS